MPVLLRRRQALPVESGQLTGYPESFELFPAVPAGGVLGRLPRRDRAGVRLVLKEAGWWPGAAYASSVVLSAP